MRLILWLVCLCCAISCHSQRTFTAKKGIRWLPTHYHAVVSIDNDTVHYQLFNHWYSHSYAQYRDVIFPLNELPSIHQKYDSLSLTISADKVKVNDAKYKFKKRVRHQKLCASISTMRKVSFADSLAHGEEGMMHFHLYEDSVLKLPEDEFRRIVLTNFKELKKE